MKHINIVKCMCLILIFFTLSCDKILGTNEDSNLPPVIESITSNPTTSISNRLAGGTTVQITVVATDPDNDVLSYAWHANEGQFDGDVDRQTVRWVAPVSELEKDYQIRVTVSDGAKTISGSITIFVDKTSTPTVVTGEISEITETSARGGGEVINDGGAEITARGIVWSTAENPTIYDNKTNDGSGIGVFMSNIMGLQLNTRYYVRGYATNYLGASYGNQISFHTPPETSTVTDIDGNVYRTVKIGHQWWMSENLKVSRYQNGDDIPNVIDNTEWSSLSNKNIGAWAYYNNDPSHNQTYGKLYNKTSVYDSRGICPTGWRIPTENDLWGGLVSYLGGWENAGGKLKSARTEPDPHPRWISPNVGATNESGWSGLPGGIRNRDGSFSSMGRYGSWWYITGLNSYFQLNAWHNRADGSLYLFDVGLSVRCVKD